MNEHFFRTVERTKAVQYVKNLVVQAGSMRAAAKLAGISRSNLYRLRRGEAQIPQRTLLARFEAKVMPEPMSGCHLWIGALGNGYGHFKADRMVQAHIWNYERLVGPVPAGLELDHRCRVKSCVNPAHLEPVTHQENILRGFRAIGPRVTCRRGHAIDREITDGRGRRRRWCSTCQASRQSGRAA